MHDCSPITRSVHAHMGMVNNTSDNASQPLSSAEHEQVSVLPAVQRSSVCYQHSDGQSYRHHGVHQRSVHVLCTRQSKRATGSHGLMNHTPHARKHVCLQLTRPRRCGTDVYSRTHTTLATALPVPTDTLRWHCTAFDSAPDSSSTAVTAGVNVTETASTTPLAGSAPSRSIAGISALPASDSELPVSSG